MDRFFFYDVNILDENKGSTITFVIRALEYAYQSNWVEISMTGSITGIIFFLA